jgi:hypothetical protein
VRGAPRGLGLRVFQDRTGDCDDDRATLLGATPTGEERAPRGRRRPPLELLERLVRELGPGNRYLVIARLDPPDDERYAQARHRPDGSWIVEYRDGGRTRHFEAVAPGPRVTYLVLAGLALGLPGWRDRLTWRPLFQ